MNELTVLCATAATVGIVHTVLGPDHYLPFVAMARARQWSMPKTATITALCGIGHVLGSVVLGFLGIGLGVAISRLEGFEAIRGDVAAWMLVAFGLAYTVWGIRRALRNRPHTHSHVHTNGTEHSHEHGHTSDHVHPHQSSKASITPWVLFTIFLFGPCEPLIPILMYPAATHNTGAVALVAVIFAVATIGTMLIMVMALNAGAERLQTSGLERWAHALAGATVLACGLAIHLGL
ncbi:MAG: sulfite exporter TauE/SafE family protein [Thermoanaerobaculales bacterium]|nr:sulfite exporter TauE/SafE family protein [Thermoanaerobaculales bacterium]